MISISDIKIIVNQRKTVINDITRKSIVSLCDARNRLMHYLLPVEREQAGIINAYGKTLADDIKTATPVPACDTAANDGYAAIASDTKGATSEAPKALSVLSSSSPHLKQLESGTTMHVRVGDPLPTGANTVIDPDNTYRPDGGPQILVLSECKPMRNITHTGALIPAGEVVLKHGTVIGACEMELIAALGRPGIPVRRKPRVAIITTGINVADIVEELKPGEVRNTARYALVGMVLSAGSDLGRLVHVRTGRVGLEKAISDCGNCDTIIIALGSNEKYDLALQALSNCGTIVFDKIHVEPGMYSSFAMVNDRPVFLTTSDSILESFEAVIRPALLTLLDRTETSRPQLPAVLGSTLKLDPGYVHYIRAWAKTDQGVFSAMPINARFSDMEKWTQPNAMIVIPENVDIVKRGETVEVILLK